MTDNPQKQPTADADRSPAVPPSSSDRPRIVVAGAGLAAARVCTSLRRKGFDGEITLIGAEPHLPYDRPPLSKAVLAGERTSTDLGVDASALELTTRLGCQVTGLDLDRQVVTTDGADEPYDALVIATGARPVRLPGDGEQLVLRTIDDALHLASRLTPGARVVLIGASWIGAEVATAALAAGCQVTCVEAAATPSNQALGDEVGGALVPLWAGVDLRLGTGVREIHCDGVYLADGTQIPADVVVTGVGVRPETGWLAGSGLEMGRGVHVDEFMVSSDPRVLAVGDVAERWSPSRGARVGGEHWDDAGSAPATAVASLLAIVSDTERPATGYDPVPYFWSDQFGRKIQYVGWHTPQDRVVLERDESGTVQVALWLDDQDRLTAWLGVNRPRSLVPARRGVGTRVDPATFFS
ncbi:MAG: NAD(P)/FAD-dependent oxidoreductase [Actinomycetales bacterium]